MTLPADAAIAKAMDMAFGRPLVMNSFRGLLVEAMVADLLPQPWYCCSTDWSSWDFEYRAIKGPKRPRLEVKQSAFCQSWPTTDKAHSDALAAKRRFDIRPKTGYWIGDRWFDDPGRQADIHVFAFHPIEDDKITDHREISQWKFYVVRTACLPKHKTISISAVRTLAEPVASLDLAKTVENAVDKYHLDFPCEDQIVHVPK